MYSVDFSKTQMEEKDLLDHFRHSNIHIHEETEERGNNNQRLDWFVVEQDLAADPTDEPQHLCTTTLIPAEQQKQSIKAYFKLTKVLLQHV